MKTKIIFLLIGIVIVIVGIGYVIVANFLTLPGLSNVNKTEVTAVEALAEASVERVSGDPDTVVQMLAPVIENGSDRERGAAVRISAESLYKKGDPQSQAEAAALLKAHIADQIASPEQRARSADLLFSFYYSEQSPELFQQIFTDGPFDSLNTSDLSEKDMIRAASEMMWDLYPTPFNAFRFALWYGSELVENQTLTEEARVQYGEELEYYLNEGRVLFSERRQNPDEFDVIKANMMNWEALLMGMLAYQNPEYQNTFEEIFSEIRSEIAAQPDNRVLLRALYTSLFYHAAMLETVYGDLREDDIHNLLDELVAQMGPVTSETENAGSFVRLIRNIARDENTNSYVHIFFRGLAERSPNFKGFLSRNGLSF